MSASTGEVAPVVSEATDGSEAVSFSAAEPCSSSPSPSMRRAEATGEVEEEREHSAVASSATPADSEDEGQRECATLAALDSGMDDSADELTDE